MASQANRDLSFVVGAIDRATKSLDKIAARLDRLERKLDKLDGKKVNVKVNVDTDERRNVRKVRKLGDKAGNAFFPPFKFVASKIQPIILAAVLAAVALMPAAGTLLAGGIVAGFGAGIAGLGVAGALANKKLRKDFTRTAKGIYRDFTDLVGPVERVLFRLTDRMRRTFDRIAPDLRRGIRNAAPGLDALLKGLLRSFEALTPAFPKLGKAFSAVMKDLGPRLPRIFGRISDALIEIADTIRANPNLFGELAEDILSLVPSALRFVNRLVKIHKAVTEFIGGLTSDTSTQLDEAGRKRIVPFEPQTKAGKLGAEIRDAVQNAMGGDFTIVQNWIDNLDKALKKVDWTKVGETVGVKTVEAAGKSAQVAAAFTVALGLVISNIDWNQLTSNILAGFVVGLLKGTGLWDVGVALVDGFINGFENKWMEVLRQGAIGALGTWFIDLVKGWFGVNSPSTVFFDIGVDVVQGFINGLLSLLGSVTGAASSLASAVRSPFAGAGGWLVDTGKSIVRGLTRGMRSQFPSANKATSAGVSGIMSKWRGLRRTRSTTEYVVNSVMAPLVRMFNQVAKSFGSAAVTVPGLARGGNVPGGANPAMLATGGPVPASQVGWTNRPTAVVGEGSRTYPEVVIPTDPKYRRRALSLFEQVGGKLMANGGILGADTAMLLDPVQWMRSQSRDTLAQLQRLPATRFNKVISEVPKKVAGMAVGKVKKLMESFGGLGGGSGPGGWRWQMAVLRSAFPGLPLISGFRPGAITATGNRSYHSMGRAVDVPPRRDVFEWIRRVFGKRTRELIFSPAGARQVWNGRPHVYSGITRAMHYNHVHWAYKRGGMLGRNPAKPVDGVLADTGNAWLDPNTFAVNRTRQPEAVLSTDVLNALLSGQGAGGGGPAEVVIPIYIGDEVVRVVRTELRADRREVKKRALAGTGANR